MIRIAFFGHDAGDAAIRRRVQGFVDDGLSITGFMMRRRDGIVPEWANIDLGLTRDGAMLQRIKAIMAGARKAAAHRDELAAADVVYARNLDMLATAFLALRLAGLRKPVVYECLDVHRLLTRPDVIGLVFRRIEGALLKHCSRLVVSSPAFIDQHFDRHHRGRFSAFLLENRLAAGAELGPRPVSADAVSPAGSPLRIGWFGVLRCRRSLDLMVDLARRFGDAIRIELHGRPTSAEIPDFQERIAGHANIAFHGAYRAPEDLARIYGGVDVVWAGDFMEAGYNSVWLLPNRLYEGGYHAVPPIAPHGTQTAAWSSTREAGFAVAEDIAETLPALIARLIEDRSPVIDRRKRLIALPDETFVQPRGALRAMIESVMPTGGAARRIADTGQAHLPPSPSLARQRVERRQP